MRRLLGIFLLAAAVSSSACSAIVGTRPGDLHCEPGSSPEEDPCPDGMRCVSGICQLSTCEALPAERCNGVDDDCDMRVDEMLEVDGDRDGYLGCNAREPERQDCDDSSPFVFPHESGRDSRGDTPAGYEPCNGRDDDCNPSTTEADGCESGEVCYRPADAPALACYPIADCRTTGGSICGAGTFCGLDGRCNPEVMGMECTPLTRDSRCQTGTYCNGAGACVDTLAIGQSCASSIECASDLCFLNRDFGLPGEGGFCGQSCCTNADCVGGFACFVPGTGARSCFPAGLVTGEPACSHHSNCGSNDCRAMSSPGGARSQCAGGTRLDAGTFCLDNNWCRSGICFQNECVDVCRSHDDCGGGGCTYSMVSPTVPHCVPLNLGSGGTGDACGGGCRDGRCWNDRCADACCTDEQCPSGYRCAVIDYGGPEMRCIPLSVGGSPG